MADSSCHIHTIRVRYAETDQAGMAHHSAFLPWFEEGRVELLRSLGKPYQQFEAEGLPSPCARRSVAIGCQPVSMMC